jgi:hypothetical protein
LCDKTTPEWSSAAIGVAFLPLIQTVVGGKRKIWKKGKERKKRNIKRINK